MSDRSLYRQQAMVTGVIPLGMPVVDTSPCPTNILVYLKEKRYSLLGACATLPLQFTHYILILFWVL